MNWLILIIAGLFEVGFTFCLSKAKEATGSTATWWIVGFFVSLSMSMYLLYKATQTLPMGTAYAVWTGIGAVGTVIVGIVFLKSLQRFGGYFSSSR
jgi:quaternary ammonium compound-resistance protein SugE